MISITACFQSLLFVSFLSGVLCSLHYDYYWRDYTGEIPSDAVKGGTDVNKKTTYIGQVYIKEWGIIPVTIYPGKKTVVANIHGLHKTDNYIKVLCSTSGGNFKWVPTNATDLHVRLINKHLVRGGVESGLVTNIGRVPYQGEVIVGKVCTYDIGNAVLFYAGESGEKNTKSYEVLVFEPKNYYWRDYTGEIPHDAVKGGTDKNNRTTYIGQVFIKDGGLIPVTIYPGQTTVVANIFRLHRTEDYIKILCSPSSKNFKWYSASATDLHTKFIGKHLVRGGVEYGLVTNIGRILYQSEIIVAKVCGFSVGNAKLYFPYKNEEKNTQLYEILVYEPSTDPEEVTIQ